MHLESKDLRLHFKYDNNDLEVSKTVTDALERLTSDYTIIIKDAIPDCANMYTPIFNDELFRALPVISEAIEDGVNEGIIAINDHDFDFVKFIQQGYWLFITNQLKENLSNVLFNHFVLFYDEETKAKILEISEEKENDFTDGLENLIRDFCEYYGDRSFNNFDDAAKEFVDKFYKEKRKYE